VESNWIHSALSIVPAPDDYDDGEIGGMMIGKGNRSTQNLPRCRFVHHKPHMLPDRRGGKPATNRLSYGTALFALDFVQLLKQSGKSKHVGTKLTRGPTFILQFSLGFKYIFIKFL
jgi:hypothetical protein